MADTIEYLYKDSVQNDIVYPITSSLAVMRENESAEVAFDRIEGYATALPGIDETNVIASLDYSGANTYTYTATQDCIVFYTTGMQSINNVFLNEVKLLTTSSSIYPAISYSFPMKKGDVFKVVQGNNQAVIIKVFGIKR